MSVVIMLLALGFFFVTALYDLKNLDLSSLGYLEAAGLGLATLGLFVGYGLYLLTGEEALSTKIPGILLTIGVSTILLMSFLVESVVIQSNHEDQERLMDRVNELVPLLEHYRRRMREAHAPASSTLSLPSVKLKQVADGFSMPVYVTSAGDGSDRMFVVEKTGRIKVITDGRVQSEPFLDIRNRVKGEPDSETDWEQGLLGLAFHPDFERNGRFFVNYTAQPDGNTVVSEFHVTESDQELERTENVILRVRQPEQSHNGGHLSFGPDGHLFVAFGDGGLKPVHRRNAQDYSSLLGAIVRLNVDQDDFPDNDLRDYGIPDDNPFVDKEKRRSEIYAVGFRNPWRFSFDPATGRLFAGDVGWNRWEEISIVKSGGNHGWPITEGRHCVDAVEGCTPSDYATPILEHGHLHYDQRGGDAVVGGYVYRGEGVPELKGTYLYADFVATRIWAARDINSQWRRDVLLETEGPVSSFGRGPDDEIYVVDYSGAIHRFVEVE